MALRLWIKIEIKEHVETDPTGKNCLTSILEQYLSSTWNQKAEGKFNSQMWHGGFIPLVHSSVSAQLPLCQAAGTIFKAATSVFMSPVKKELEP